MKTILKLFVLSLVLTSCSKKKDYSCICTFTASDTQVLNLANVTLEEAEDLCYGSLQNGIGDCVLEED